MKGYDIRRKCLIDAWYKRFDGDEMNIFIPQSLQTQLELEEIACVERQIITPTTSKTIVGVVQDGLLGAYNLTSPTVRIDWRTAMNIMSYTSLDDFSAIKKNKDCAGTELYSLILPPGISVSRATIKIKNGQLVDGRLSKEMLGSKKKNNLIQLIWDGYGVEDTKNFIDNTQRLVNNFNLWHGFSVGINDTNIHKDVYSQIDKMFQTKDLQVEHIITETENNPDFMNQEMFEHRIFSELNIIRDDVSKLIMANLGANNGFNIMATSGSKGDATTIVQMMGCLGMQAFEGKLMPKKYNGRTSAYFFQNDDRGASRGLIRQSFIKGMEFPGFVFHLSASRLGLIEQAVKSVTGDTQIVIQENEETKCVAIGEWIDKLMDENKDKIEHIDKHNQDLLKLTHKVYIPTCDNEGKTSWGLLTDITRHETTEYLYEVETYGGRKVTVADSKSLLIWNDSKEEFEPVLSSKVTIDDCVPVTMDLQDPPNVRRYIDMVNYFPKTKCTANAKGYKNTRDKKKAELEKSEHEESESESEEDIRPKKKISKKVVKEESSESEEEKLKTKLKISNKDAKTEKQEEIKEAKDKPLDKTSGQRYLYGTDFYLAEKMTKEEIKGKRQTTPGWWEKHNGLEFTVPYWRAADLLRATSGRSSVKSIKSGFIYPFSKSREVGLPEKFELNRENGVFIGLYIAQGNSDPDDSGYVQITDEDKDVQKFVEKWFDKLNIKHKHNVREMMTGENKDIKGTTQDIRGWSTMLGKFLEKLVGKGSRNKYVPDEAFDAPKEFIIGLLDGYFSGDGHVRDNSITACSASRKLIEGVSFLCSRLGIVGRVTTTYQKENNLGTKDIAPMHILDIRGQFAKSFKRQIKLTKGYKNTKLQQNKFSDKYKYFEEQEDVVLDKIIKINKIKGDKKKFLYDVTVPSTLIFQIKNGINCQDTAETGYTQRKLIKSMEDIMIKYDGTVRSANDGIIQFIYGDSGADTTKQYEYALKLIEMSNEELKTKIKFTSDELKNVKGFSEEENKNLYEKVKAMRDFIRDVVRKARMNYIVLVTNFMLPVNLNRIIDTVHGNPELKDSEKPTPKYIIDKLEDLLDNRRTTILCMSQKEREDKNSFKMKDESTHKKVFHCALYDALGPKRVLFDLNLNKKQFDTIVEEISASFKKNIVEPGEMAGIIAAQSTGEPLTQLTLNSVDWKEKIIIIDKKSEKEIIVKIGEFIDNFMNNESDKVQHKGNNLEYEMGDIHYLDVNEYELYIKSVNEDGKVSNKKIEGLTKHLVINKDGSSKVLKVTTSKGLSVVATRGESFLTLKDNKIVVTRGDELQLSSMLPIELETNTKFNDVYMDDIVSIEEVDPTCKYVYDITVEDTRTFCLANGHYCFDSFHHAGISSIGATLQGVPRMKELLSVSKKPKTPQMVIYLTDEFMANKDMAHKIASQIKHTTLGDIRGRISVYYDPFPNGKNSIMQQDNVKQVFFQHKGSKTGCQADINGLPFLMRIEIDREKMLDKEVNLLEIKSKFCSWWETRFADAKTMKKEEKKVITKITQLAVLSNSDNDKQPVIHIRFNAKDVDKDKFDLTTMTQFISYIIDKFELKGISFVDDITAVQEERILTFNPESGTIDKNAQWVIYVAGVNLKDIRYLIGVDLSKTISNHVMEIYETFGIEIARAVLLREVANAYERAGGEVNYQHISMIVDQMTSTGSINSVDRHGMNKSDSDPLSRASFEKTVEQLLTAAVYGETDHMKGVSSRIMIGAVAKGGTGFPELELDTEMIEKSEYVEESDYTRPVEINKGTLAGDIVNKKIEGIFIPM